MKVCRECGTDRDVHRGLCRHCRARARGKDFGPASGADKHLHMVTKDLEPQHDQPWVPRSAFTDRLRRSPRR